MDLFDLIANGDVEREDMDDHLIGGNVIVDMDGAGMQSMDEYLERFPNRHEHQSVTQFEWGLSFSPVLIIVNHEAGAWQIGAYPIDDPETSVWFARVVDETQAVLTLHVLTEVL